MSLKTDVHDFWNAASCGEVYAVGDDDRTRYEAHARQRYRLEPYIPTFAKFEEGPGKDVLEIGIGLGADFLEWARRGPRSLTGVDMTERAVEHTKRRLDVYGLSAHVQVADAESLPFPDDSFDIVYSWGVLHHTPDTPRALAEVRRVLRPGGTARIMVYHKYALVGYMLWARYGLLAGRPRRGLGEIYAEHLESPGTKAYTVPELSRLLGTYSRLRVWSALSFGDLLEGEVGQRHRGALLSAARRLYPRWLVRTLFRGHGLLALAEATK